MENETENGYDPQPPSYKNSHQAALTPKLLQQRTVHCFLACLSASCMADSKSLADHASGAAVPDPSVPREKKASSLKTAKRGSSRAAAASSTSCSR